MAVSPLAIDSPAAASDRLQPRRSAPIIATGQQREQLRALPIEQRPNRPLHVYGNTVRRMHQRGVSVPPRRELPARSGSRLPEPTVPALR